MSEAGRFLVIPIVVSAVFQDFQLATVWSYTRAGVVYCLNIILSK